MTSRSPHQERTSAAMKAWWKRRKRKEQTMTDNVIHLINTVIGHNICLRMREQGLTLTELARRSNMRKGQLSEIANGKNGHPSVWTMARIASGLGCRVDDLISVGEYDE